MKKRNKKIIAIFAVLAIIAVVAGISATLAFFTDAKEGTAQTFTTGTLKINYATGRNISGVNLIPTNDESTAAKHEFTVENKGNMEAGYTIKFKNISLTKPGDPSPVATSSDNLRWALYKATINEEDYIISGVALATGTFGETSSYTAGMETLVIAGDDLNLSVAEKDASGDKQPFVLRIWLNNSDGAQNEDQGLSFSAIIEVTATQK